MGFKHFHSGKRWKGNSRAPGHRRGSTVGLGESAEENWSPSNLAGSRETPSQLPSPKCLSFLDSSRKKDLIGLRSSGIKFTLPVVWEGSPPFKFSIPNFKLKMYCPGWRRNSNVLSPLSTLSGFRGLPGLPGGTGCPYRGLSAGPDGVLSLYRPPEMSSTLEMPGQ